MTRFVYASKWAYVIATKQRYEKLKRVWSPSDRCNWTFASANSASRQRSSSSIVATSCGENILGALNCLFHYVDPAKEFRPFVGAGAYVLLKLTRLPRIDDGCVDRRGIPALDVFNGPSKGASYGFIVSGRQTPDGPVVLE